jgi:hypothetical protein
LLPRPCPYCILPPMPILRRPQRPVQTPNIAHMHSWGCALRALQEGLRNNPTNSRKRSGWRLAATKHGVTSPFSLQGLPAISTFDKNALFWVVFIARIWVFCAYENSLIAYLWPSTHHPGKFPWSGPRPGGLALRLRGSWGTEVRGWPPATSVLTRLAACESVSAKAKRKTDIVCACGNK